MADAEQTRDTLRRRTYDLKVGLTDLAEMLKPIDEEASGAARDARLAAFHAWTLLARPFEEEEDY